jgi:glycosyltransferase involved in cell wall biosynthesis
MTRTIASKRVLFVAHNHPAIRPGGAEAYALDAYKAMRDGGEFEPVFLARSGPPLSVASRYHEGRPITLVNDDPNQYFFYTDPASWDRLYGRTSNKTALTRFYRDFLLDQRPDIVHFQHTQWLGYDIVRVTRNTLPDAPIVYSLHEYLPICHRAGQLVRTRTDDLCEEELPRRCHECFPEISEQTFFMRKRFIQSHLGLVDRFLIASRYARERYIDWGIPEEKIFHEPYGHVPARIPGADESRARDRFGFFGQFTPFKGADVLLEAMALLGSEFDGLLRIHGANLDTCPADFQKKIVELLEQAGDRVTLVGQYEREEVTSLMEHVDWVIVPSIWWETGPLTVAEAFQHGRPVICSDMGGMSEQVTDGVNGLYFARRDPESLAEVMCRAAGNPGLWERLRLGIPAVRSMHDHVAALGAHYKALLAKRTVRVEKALAHG